MELVYNIQLVSYLWSTFNARMIVPLLVKYFYNVEFYAKQKDAVRLRAA
jgi:hypothetical protein